MNGRVFNKEEPDKETTVVWPKGILREMWIFGEDTIEFNTHPFDMMYGDIEADPKAIC